MLDECIDDYFFDIPSNCVGMEKNECKKSYYEEIDYDK